MENQEIVDLFAKKAFAAHPVWLLQGEPGACGDLANRMVAAVSSVVHANDVAHFNLTRTTMKQFFDFLNLYAANIKIAVCTLNARDDYMTTTILKCIEDLPEAVIIILISPVFPPVLSSRGMLFYVMSKHTISEQVCGLLDRFPDMEAVDELKQYDDCFATIQTWFERKTIKQIPTKDLGVIEAWYESWNKLIELRYWLDSGQMNSSTAIEISVAILLTVIKGEKYA